MNGSDFVKLISACGSKDPQQLSRQQVFDNLDSHGVVLIRDFEFDLDAFEALTTSVCHDFHHVGTRVKLKEQAGDGYSTEVHRQNFTLLSHSEGTYRPWPPAPELCFFCCVSPPLAKGGETSLVDGVRILEMMPDRLRERFMQSDIIYEMYWEPQRWRAEFQVEDTSELEKLLNEHPSLEYDFRGEDLVLHYRTSAICQSRSGQPAFANALLAHLPRITHPAYQQNRVYTKSSNHVYFENGEEIEDETINVLIDIQDKLMYLHEWQTGDLLVIDNTRFMHGRRMTQTDCERILLSRFGSPGGSYQT
jgi:alpha-ketoglutarate-dependent taurine dioxygenase